VPGNLHGVTAIAAGCSHCLALADNTPPIAVPQTVSGSGGDVVITLAGNDVDNDVLAFRIATLSADGALYQYSAGTRGELIGDTNTFVSDPAGRVIYAGHAASSFDFTANDGTCDSALARVTVTGFPYVYTQPATFISKTSATFNGLAVPNGFPTRAWFEWGQTRSYGYETPVMMLGDGGTVTPAVAQVTSLAPGAVYHVRLVVSNAVAIVRGADQTFAAGAKFCGWGDNSWGQCSAPTTLKSPVTLSAASNFSFALQTDGSALVWGKNFYGAATIPAGLSNVVTIAAGGVHSLALLADGSVVGWGGDDSGQIDIPARLTNVVEIAGSGYDANYSLALTPNAPPVSTPQTLSTPLNQDLVISLSGSDPDNDPLTFTISTLPQMGSLFQSDRGGRGQPILGSGAAVTDPSGRVIFAPGQGRVSPTSRIRPRFKKNIGFF
jgi:Regulator of chromosome condensation (RCC1) repeat